MHIPESCRRRTRHPQLHVNTGSCVHHPGRQLHDDPRRTLDKDEAACGVLFAVLQWQTLAMQRMPAIVDLNMLPDMGRMNG